METNKNSEISPWTYSNFVRAAKLSLASLLNKINYFLVNPTTTTTTTPTRPTTTTAQIATSTGQLS